MGLLERPPRPRAHAAAPIVCLGGARRRAVLQHLRKYMALERLLMLHDGALVRALQQRRARRARVLHSRARLARLAEQLLGVPPTRAPSMVSAAPRMPYAHARARASGHMPDTL